MKNFEIEEEILGTILLKPKSIERLVITEDYFFNPMYKFIFKLLKQQYTDSKTIDIVCLAENYKHLFTKYTTSEIIVKSSELMAEAMPIDNLDYYQLTMFSRYVDSQIMNSIKKYSNERITKEEMLEDIHKYECMSIELNDGKLTAEKIYKLITSKNANINFRFKALSEIANIQEHDFVVIGARTGIGKSAFILNLIEDLSDNYNCLLFNMEIAEKQIFQRLVAINTKVPMKYHNSPETDHQAKTIEDGCKNIASKQIKIIEGSQSVATIRRKIINESKNSHTLVFIDYVGLIDSRGYGKNNYEKITAITKELRQISLDYDCTIFLVSQLNRGTETKDLPKISDLKESGELEQSATTVLLLHDKDFENNKDKKEVQIDVVIGKNRNGRLGVIQLNYNKICQRYDGIKRYQ